MGEGEGEGSRRGREIHQPTTTLDLKSFILKCVYPQEEFLM